eukprot:s2668_g9.t1
MLLPAFKARSAFLQSVNASPEGPDQRHIPARGQAAGADARLLQAPIGVPWLHGAHMCTPVIVLGVSPKLRSCLASCRQARPRCDEAKARVSCRVAPGNADCPLLRSHRLAKGLSQGLPTESITL